MSLYFVCNHDKIVFTFSPAEEGEWRFSRLSLFQKNKGLERFVLLYRTVEQTDGWIVMDQTHSKGEVVGRPCKELADSQQPEGPQLSGCPPMHPGLVIDRAFPLEVPFATVNYSEEGPVARLEVTMHNVPIVDEVLEQVLARLASLLQNLAQRPEMVLFIRSDARNSAVPAVRHIKRFLGFVQENGSEFVLVGRGHAIVLSPKGIFGNTLVSILRLVQRLFPAPWPESTVPTMEAAEEFVAELARRELTQQRAASVGKEAPLEHEKPGHPFSPPKALVERELASEAQAADLLAAPCRSRPPSKQNSKASLDNLAAESQAKEPGTEDRNCLPPEPVGEATVLGNIPGFGRARGKEVEAEEPPLPMIDISIMEMPGAFADNAAFAGDCIDNPAIGGVSSGPWWFCGACRPCQA
eukprot:CAMPEP_0171189850 /NCGR_PEP_ID=MMETSP0790-20130122/18558_1 /TAXON_ID=2925 /ORGANISM="Alexandrium catenella, Strain OF101" /LENGTH=410 /DNA_ID=CAMNT_0011654973 /DNA_START=60 /DNA_END=1288 /DNA_ORIENTATION=+